VEAIRSPEAGAFSDHNAAAPPRHRAPGTWRGSRRRSASGGRASIQGSSRPRRGVTKRQRPPSDQAPRPAAQSEPLQAALQGPDQPARCARRQLRPHNQHVLTRLGRRWPQRGRATKGTGRARVVALRIGWPEPTHLIDGHCHCQACQDGGQPTRGRGWPFLQAQRLKSTWIAMGHTCKAAGKDWATSLQRKADGGWAGAGGGREPRQLSANAAGCWRHLRQETSSLQSHGLGCRSGDRQPAPPFCRRTCVISIVI